MVFEGPESFGTTAFSYFPLATKHFGDGGQHAMVNFRVDNLGELLTELAAAWRIRKIRPEGDLAGAILPLLRPLRQRRAAGECGLHPPAAGAGRDRRVHVTG